MIMKEDYCSYKEDYCSYEVSKLLKDKGFNDPFTHMFINKDNVKFDCSSSGVVPKETIACPTHQMAMKWLREVYKIYIDIETCYTYINKNENFEVTGYEFTIHSQYEPCYEDHETYNSYEKAVEAALKYILENLI